MKITKVDKNIRRKNEVDGAGSFSQRGQNVRLFEAIVDLGAVGRCSPGGYLDHADREIDSNDLFGDRAKGDGGHSGAAADVENIPGFGRAMICYDLRQQLGTAIA